MIELGINKEKDESREHTVLQGHATEVKVANRSFFIKSTMQEVFVCGSRQVGKYLSGACLGGYEYQIKDKAIAIGCQRQSKHTKGLCAFVNVLASINMIFVLMLGLRAI